MKNYMGASTFLALADPLDDYIKHIDCWGKFLEVDKILITQVPTSDYRYADYEALATFFATRNCSWGYPYQVYRVQAAASNDNDTNPYTNSLILNKKVFVPQTGSTFDDEALAVYSAAMPGYEIIPMPTNLSSAPWENTDALHCRTHEVADRHMVFIKHFPLFGVQQSANDYAVSAEIYAYGIGVAAKDIPQLHYKIGAGNFISIDMQTADSKTYTASIPKQNEGTEIKYYITAKDASNRVFAHPTIGEPDAHSFVAGAGLSDVYIVKNHAEVSVFPNPCYGGFYISSGNKEIKNAEISIYDITGKLVYKSSSEKTEVLGMIRIQLPENVKGVQFVKIKTETFTVIKKIVVN
jgi:hypothetical protein